MSSSNNFNNLSSSLSSSNDNTHTTSLTTSIYNTFTNPLVILTVLVFIIIVILMTNIFDFDLGYSGYNTPSNSFGYGTRPNYYATQDSGILGYLSYFIFLILFLIIIYYALYYLFGIELYSFIMNFFYPQPNPTYVPNVTSVPSYLTMSGSSTSLSSTSPLPSSTSSSITTPNSSQEVYNVPGNFYTYDDANAVCKAFGGRLAKYKEVEDSYNNGGEWCNYGWSDEQMALFPTQQTTYDSLQKKKGAEHNCGRPGINGGYLANPSLKFGANCYGLKPQINSQEQQNMQNVSSTPITQDDINFQNKVDFWKGQLDSIILAPFNYNEWSETQNITKLTTRPEIQQTAPYITTSQTTPYSQTTSTTVTSTNQNSITYPNVSNKYNNKDKTPSPNATIPSTYTTTNPTQSLTPTTAFTTPSVTINPNGNTDTTVTTSPPISWWSSFWSYFTIPTYPPYYSSTATDTSSTTIPSSSLPY